MSGDAAPALAGFTGILQQTTVAYLDRARACPFLKCAGGEHALVLETVKVLPPQFGDYEAPVYGDGAVFFALDRRICPT